MRFFFCYVTWLQLTSGRGNSGTVFIQRLVLPCDRLAWVAFTSSHSSWRWEVDFVASFDSSDPFISSQPIRAWKQSSWCYSIALFFSLSDSQCEKTLHSQPYGMLQLKEKRREQHYISYFIPFPFLSDRWDRNYLMFSLFFPFFLYLPNCKWWLDVSTLI